MSSKEHVVSSLIPFKSGFIFAENQSMTALKFCKIVWIEHTDACFHTRYIPTEYSHVMTSCSWKWKWIMLGAQSICRLLLIKQSYIHYCVVNCICHPNLFLDSKITGTPIRRRCAQFIWNESIISRHTIPKNLTFKLNFNKMLETFEI